MNCTITITHFYRGLFAALVFVMCGVFLQISRLNTTSLIHRPSPANSSIKTSPLLQTKQSLPRLTVTVTTERVRTFPWKPVKVHEVDCSSLFADNATERDRALIHQKSSTGVMASNDQVIQLAQNCSELIRERGFITSSLTKEEKNFPIAYSILVYKEAGQVLHLLRTIYRPQNLYCIHVDLKADHLFRRAMTAVADCFPNVFLSSRSVDVRWGTFTVLEPEIICMQDLWNRSSTWKYFINLTGQEFPLKTNHELVKILKAYNGANDVVKDETMFFAERWKKSGTPPHGIRPWKGAVHVAVNRDFVDYAVHSHVAKDFLQWCKGTKIPDETFFSSLNHNPQLGIRGIYNGTYGTRRFNMVRYKKWHPFPCWGGKYVRWICILTVGDLPSMRRGPEMFANKFYSNHSRLALECLAEDLYNRTRDEYLGQLEFNVSRYENLPFVKYAVRPKIPN